MINFKSIPFLKILLPYLIGIFTVTQLGIIENLHGIFIISLLIWCTVFILQKKLKLTKRYFQTIYILFTNCFLFLLAFESCFFYNEKNSSDHYSNYTSTNVQFFTGSIQDIPILSNKFIKLSVKINCIESNKQWHYAKGNTIIYLKNDTNIKLIPGQMILVKGKFNYVSGPKNPYEFDYKHFLENKNIFHVVYTNAKHIYFVSNQNSYFSFSELGIKIKSHLVEIFRKSGLSQEAFSICSALLVGYDDEIDGDIIQQFSHSGTLHILSVSGMHTGILYASLLFLFTLFDKNEQRKRLRFVIVVMSLLLFVFVTGFSPSVLRATLMLSLVLFGKTFYTQGNSYNTLLVSAFILLLFNPYLILDVGFLLSYLAVFGIMYLHPIINKVYYFNNTIIRWIWNSISISISATLFTLPISLYYFHQFPLWFILSNLIIIPISVLLMIASMLLILFFKTTIVKHLIVISINQLVNLMLWFTKLTDSSKFGFIDHISFSEFDLICLFLTIFSFLCVLYYKNYSSVVTICLVLIIWLVDSIYSNYKDTNKKELVVFHVNHKSVFLFRLGNHVYIHANDISQQEYQRNVKPYLLNISNSIKTTTTKANLYQHQSTTIIYADTKKLFTPPPNSNYIIVTHDTPIELTTNCKTKPLIIADCSNSYKFVKKLKQECALKELAFYSVKEKGAIQIDL